MKYIRCILLEIDTDNRAVVITGDFVGDEDHAAGSIETTEPLQWIDYRNKMLSDGFANYDFRWT